MIYQSFDNNSDTVRIRIVLTHSEWVRLPVTVQRRLETESRRGISRSRSKRVIYLR